MNRNVLIFGATGKTGSLICKELESNNVTYSVFVREQSSSKITTNSVTIKQGDVENAQDVKDAFKNENFTDVIVALGSQQLRKSNLRSKGTDNIIEAMKTSQAESTIHVISALGVGDSWNQLKWHGKLISNILLKSVMSDHTMQEAFVQKSPFKYHILRPVGLKDGPAKGGVIVQNEGFLPGNYIQRADVAEYLVKSLLENKRGVSGICQ